MVHRHFSLGSISQADKLSDEAYDEIASKGKDVFVVATADALITRPNGDVLLGFRIEEPCGNEWWYVGGRMQRGESQVVAVVRNIIRETGMVFESKRFYPLGGYSLVWPKRKQSPQENGCHDSSNLFWLSLMDDEAHDIRLNKRDFSMQQWCSPEEILRGNYVRPLQAAVWDMRMAMYRERLYRAIDSAESWGTIASVARHLREAEAMAKALEV